jgi:hypothetical protein
MLTANPEKAKQADAERRRAVFGEFRTLVNMTAAEMQAHFATPDSDLASLSPKKTATSGRTVTKAKTLPIVQKIEAGEDLTDDDYADMATVIRPLRMQLARTFAVTREDGTPTLYTTALRNRGHDPVKARTAEGIELSLDRKREIISAAVREFFRAIFPEDDEHGGIYAWTREIYDQSGRAIVECEGTLYEVRYVIDGGDVVIAPELTRVEQAYLPVAESFDPARAALLEMREAEGDSGPVWRAIMIRAGEAINRAANGKRRNYTADVLRAAVAEGLFSYKPAYQRTDSEHTAEEGLTIDGNWGEAVYDEQLQAVVNDFTWRKDRYPSAFDKKIRTALAEGNTADLPGCSITGSVEIDPKAPHVPLRITEIRSCDWISYASAGGTLIAISESHHTHQETTMKNVVNVLEAKGMTVPDALKKQWANVTVAEADEAAAWMVEQLKAKRPKLFEASPTLEKDLTGNQTMLVALFQEFMEAEKGPAPVVEPPATDGQQQAVQQSAPVAEAQKKIDALAQKLNDMERDSAIRAAKLTEAEERFVTGYLKGQAFTPALLQEAITEAKELFGSVSESKRGTRPEVTKDGTDKFRTMVNDFFHFDIRDTSVRAQVAESLKDKGGLSPHAGRAIAPSRIFEAITGVRAEDAYSYSTYASISEAMDSTLATAILVNGMQNRMLYEFNLSPLFRTWRNICRVGAKFNFKTNEVMVAGGFTGYATVAKGDDYGAITETGLTKETYAIIKRGGIFDLSLEDIRNDDVDYVAGLPGRLGRYASRMLSAYVWAFVTANAALSDGDALFHANHNNLVGAALDATSLATAIGYLQGQGQPNSTDKLGTLPKYLATPIAPAMQKTAYELTQNAYGTNNAVATWAQNLGISPIVNPHSTATDYWWLFGDPMDIPIIEMSFLDGREEPEIQSAQTEGVGTWFSAHKAQFRIFHAYNGAVATYKGAVGGKIA